RARRIYRCAMASEGQPDESVARRYAVLRPYLDERQRRLLLGAEAAELGRGGIKAVALATGVHPDTVAKGARELEAAPNPRVGCGHPAAAASRPPRTTPGSGRPCARWSTRRPVGIRPRRWCGRRSRPATWPTR